MIERESSGIKDKPKKERNLPYPLKGFGWSYWETYWGCATLSIPASFLIGALFVGALHSESNKRDEALGAEFDYKITLVDGGYKTECYTDLKPKIESTGPKAYVNFAEAECFGASNIKTIKQMEVEVDSASVMDLK